MVLCHNRIPLFNPVHNLGLCRSIRAWCIRLSEDQDEEEEPDFMAYQIDEEMRKKRVFPSQVEDIEAEKDLGPAMCVTPFAVAPTQEKDIAEEDRMFHEFMRDTTEKST